MEMIVLLERLENVREGSKGFNARCPNHEDKHNSLSVMLNDKGKIIVKCFAGCPTEDVLKKSILHLQIYTRRSKKAKSNRIRYTIMLMKMVS